MFTRPLQTMIALLSVSALSLSVFAFTNPKSYARLPVSFSPVSGVGVKISSQGNRVVAQLPAGKLQPLGELPDIPEGSMDMGALLLQDDFNFDGMGDVAVLDGVGYGGVNLFYRLYLWDAKMRQFSEFRETISNPTLTEATRTLCTGERSGPRWYTTDYRFEQGNAYVWAESMMVGNNGDLYLVRLKKPDGKVVRTLVADTQDPSGIDEKTPPARRLVTVKKAVLHDKPQHNATTAMHLTHGDEVELLDYVQNQDGSEWFKVRYQGKKVVEKWVQWESFNNG